MPELEVCRNAAAILGTRCAYGAVMQTAQRLLLAASLSSLLVACHDDGVGSDENFLGDDCAADQEPGENGNPLCFEGASCCADGTWRCNDVNNPNTCAAALDCLASEEPGENGNPLCFEGATCCADGEWRCNDGNSQSTCDAEAQCEAAEPNCIEGATCCTDGEWRCNNGAGQSTCE